MTDKEAGKQPQQPSNYPRGPPPFPPPKCPRCYSSNTKFCYYNNYSMSQPRYICKVCRRYWTHGGVLRNIPCGGTNRKRGRTDCASSSSQISKPPPVAGGSMRYARSPASTSSSSSSSHGTFKPEITQQAMTQTMQSFNGGGFSYQSPFLFNPNYEFGGVNTSFGGVNVGFGGGATSQPAPSTMMWPQISTLSGFGQFGIPFAQRSRQPPPPPPPPQQQQPLNVWDATVAANVVNINEWSELIDMDNEDDPLQSYKPPSP